MKHNFSIIIISAIVVLLSSISLSYALPSKRSVSSPPRSIRVQQTQNSLLITWKKPLRSVDGYRIYRSNYKKILGEKIVTINDSNIKSFTDSSVKPGTKYYYTVRSFLHSGAESTNKRQIYKMTQIYKIVKIARQPPPSQPVCNSGNSSGEDGNYFACVGNTIVHQPSGVTATPTSIDDFKVILNLSGLPGNNTMTLTVYKNSTANVGGNNGYEIAYKYNNNSPSTGAFITIASKASVNPVDVTPTPTVTPTPIPVITSNVPKKFLTIIAVNKGAEGKYEDNGWERTSKFKENGDIQIFDVAMWDNGQPTNPNKISLYKFDRTFDPFKAEYIEGGQAWVNYRESFNILNIAVPQSCSMIQGTSYYECSHANPDAFKRIVETIVRNQPAEHYGIKYGGHGSDVGLFANTFSGDDSQLLLSYINSIIGKKLDFLDWSTNCDMGTYSVIASQYRYADYILSSDLLRGGFNIEWVNDYYRLKPEAILDRFFGPSKTIKQSLVDMVNSERLIWETETTKTDMVAKQIKQSLSIYDSSKFENLMTSAYLEQGIRGGDVLGYIRKNYPSLEQQFYDFRFHYVSNKDFFPWNENSNGFKF